MWLLPGTVCSSVLILNVMPRETTWATTSLWPFQSISLKDYVFFPVCSALYIQLYHLQLLHFRKEVLFHGTQNLLEFDPNFENALSLIVSSRGEKWWYKFCSWWWCLCFCNCRWEMLHLHSRRTPPQNNPFPKLYFSIYAGERQAFFLAFLRASTKLLFCWLTVRTVSSLACVLDTQLLNLVPL